MKQTPCLSQVLSQTAKSSTLQLPSLYYKKFEKNSLHSHKINASSLTTMLGSHIVSRFEQKLVQKIGLEMSHEEYEKKSTHEISKEYIILKSQLKHISQQLDKLIESKVSNASKVTNSSSSILVKSRFSGQLSNTYKLCLDQNNNIGRVYQGFEKNNQKILLNNSLQLSKLLERQEHILNSTDPYGKMEELKNNIQKTRNQLKQEKKEYKQLLLESQKTGTAILNTENLIEEIRLLEKELNVVTLRKRKLEKQSLYNSERQQAIYEGNGEIIDKEKDLGEYEEEKKKNMQVNKKQLDMCNEKVKKQRIINAMKRDKQAKQKISSKHYCELLTQLNQLEKRSETCGINYDSVQQSISVSNKEYQLRKEQFQIILKQKKQKKSKNSGRSFLTEIQNIQPKQENYKTTNKREIQQCKIEENYNFKEIEENLLKTQKNLYQIEKKSDHNINLQPKIQQKQNPKSNKTLHTKKHLQLFDSEILEEEQYLPQYQAPSEQLQERFRENENQYKIVISRQIRG